MHNKFSYVLLKQKRTGHSIQLREIRPSHHVSARMRNYWFIYQDFIDDFPSDLVVAMDSILIGYRWETEWTTILGTICLEYKERPLLQNHLTSVLLCWRDTPGIPRSAECDFPPQHYLF